MSKISIIKFQNIVKSYAKSQIISLDPKLFVFIDGLNPWYSVAHLQACYPQLFFLYETKEENKFYLPAQKYICPKCKTKQSYKCLCQNLNSCDDCSRYDDRQIHRYICKFARPVEIACQPMIIKDFSKQGLIGMRNPDNLCYLNTALQCLLAIRPLTNYFLQLQYFRDINLANPQGCFGQIAIRYASLVRNAWCQSFQIYDSNIFRQSLSKYYNEYLQTQKQQDSNQCLSHILSCLSEDLNRIFPKNKSYCEQIASENQEILAQKSWEDHLSKNNSIIEEILTGVFKSQIKCLKCGATSPKFDPFVCLDLPIAPTKKKTIQKKYTNVLFIPLNAKQKMTYINIFLENESLECLQKKTRQTLGLKSYRHIVFYLLSIKQDIKRLTWKNNLASYYQQINNNKYKLCCLEYTEEQLSSNMLEMTLSIEQRNMKLQTYEECCYKRPLYFNKINRPKYGRQLFKKILQYFFNFIFINNKKITQDQYLAMYLQQNKTPFKLFLSTDLSQNVSVQIFSQDQIKLTANYGQLIVRFENSDYFNLKNLVITKKHESIDSKQKHGIKKQIIITEPASIYDCLDMFRSKEILQDWKCQKCNRKGGQKTITIYKAPKILIVCLKRFEKKAHPKYPGQFIMKKKSDPVLFDGTLDMRGYVQKQEMPMWQGIEGLEYRLLSVANHLQQPSQKQNPQGHYYSMIINRHIWYLCNDEKLISTNSGYVFNSKNAYYMIYQRMK